MSKASDSFSSPHFEIQELADGVYAVLGEQHGLCHSNAAIVDLGDQTLVLDTLTLPSYGEDLAIACRELTGRDPSWIALTHYHADHWLGNQAFPRETPLIATPGMQPGIENSMIDYQEAIDEPSGFAKQVEDYAAACEDENDATAREGMEINLGRYRALLDELTSIQLIRENTLFEGRLQLVGSKRLVELIEVANAHTVSDVFLKLPEERIVFMGDLGFFDTIPFLAFADPVQWIDTLQSFEASDTEVFVPGHGVVGGMDRVKLERECIEAVVFVVREALDAGDDITLALTKHLPEPFMSWASGRGHMEMNYKAVAEALSSDSQN